MLTPDQAGEFLREVDKTHERSKHYLRYWRSGAIVQLWGVVWFAAYLGSWLFPAHSGYFWLVGDTAGVLGTVYHARRQRLEGYRTDRRIWLALLTVMTFGVLVSIFLLKQPGAVSVFWTFLFMLAYMLAGLWLGLRWTLLGAVVCMLTLLAYLFLMPWFNLAMAILGGGGLVLGGTWLRRAK
jgi:hypothetical protein